MSRPTVIDSIGGYTFDWLEEKVKIVVSRMHVHSDGTVKGEVMVKSTDPAVTHPHLHQAQFNFSSSATREKLAKILAQRVNGFDWYAILEQLSVITLDRVRCGEPVQELMAGEEVRPPEFILKPFIIRNYPTILFGERSSSKSTTALALSQLITLPWQNNPLNLTVPKKSIRCLYLDWETDADTVNWQLTRMDKGMNIGGCTIGYRRCSFPLAQDLEQIIKSIASSEAEVVIIDSLGVACGGDLNKSEAPLAFYAALRQLKTTSLILAHTSKDKENKNKTVFGSSYFENLARNIWEVTKRQDAGEDEMDIGLFHRKPPPFLGVQPSMAFKLTFTDSTISFVSQDPRNIDEFMDMLGVKAKILKVLSSGPKTNAEIMAATELNASTVNTNVYRLKKQGKITKIGEKYGLVFDA